MRPITLSDGRAKLAKALKTARLQWDEVRVYWQDAVSKDFEENHWKPLGPLTQAALQAIDRLDVVLREAQRECE